MTGAGPPGGSDPAPTRPVLGPFVAFLYCTAAVCGALVMVLEVLGSRVIGPFYGVSLFVWTSLITVTLLALAAGYAAGGLLSDRWQTPTGLYGFVMLAGVVVLVIPSVMGGVLKACQPLGLRAGSFASTLALFGPPLFLLGCVPPYATRLALRETRAIGRTVGAMSALSTLGSVGGTVTTGFVLIAHLGIDGILRLTGGLLVALALVYFVGFRRRWVALASLGFLGLPLGSAPARPAVLPNGTRVTQIASVDSFYGRLKVVDYAYPPVHTREMLIDGLIQGGVDVRSGESVYPYAYFLQYLPTLVKPGGRRALMIGLGAGLLPRWYAARGVETDVVDIDPEVVRLARTYFGFPASGRVVIDDARHFLATVDRPYDYVILDVFNGDTTPGYLLSREAVSLLRARLTPGGVLGVNLVGSLGPGAFMTASVVRTLEQAFESVSVYRTYEVAGGVDHGNLAIIAVKGLPVRDGPTVDLATWPLHPLARREAPVVARPHRIPPDAPAVVLTDDYNPIDVYDAWLRERVRAAIVGGTSWDILVSTR